VFCPCQPAASSIELVIALAELIKGTGAAFGVLLTMCDARRADLLSCRCSPVRSPCSAAGPRLKLQG